MKVLIIGSEGMLGHDLVDILSEENEISTTTSKETDSALVYICTDYVFDGEKGSSYQEYDQTNPLSVYGKTKLQGETYIRDILSKFYIVRTSWLYGYHGPNFVTTMLKLAETMDTISVVNDQIGSPTYTIDLAKAIAKLIKKPSYGIYHITNNGECSWYEYACQIFEMAGIEINVNPVSTEEYPQPAPRPKYSVLENYNWKMEGFSEIRDYKDALQDYMKLL